MKRNALTPQFVEFIPTTLQDGVLYVSLAYSTASHLCCCGCGKEVVTPLSPTDWKLVCDGETVSLDPSIGNWSLACRSHYWIRRNRVHWAGQMSRDRIEAGRAHDRAAKARYYGAPTPSAPNSDPTRPSDRPPPTGADSRIRDGRGLWAKLIAWLKSPS